jgi:alkylation response protein AidB-like acyl-CoA dehydrogenase
VNNPILDRIRAARELIRAEAPVAEAQARLTDATVATIRDAGVFGMTMSRELGGPQLTLFEQLEVLEELSAADGAAGWCGMINSDSGYVSAFLDREVARKMYPSTDIASAVIAAPSGQAVVDGDSYIVTGQWAFASGCNHSDWIWVNGIVIDEGVMKMLPDGSMPETRMCAIPAADLEILDTWRTTGLCGTGSNDVKVEAIRVPAERTFSIFDGDPVDQAPLYRWRWTFFVNLPAVQLGIARAAISDAIETAGVKVTMPDMQLAREDPTLQHNVGRAQGLVRSARSYVFETVGRFWDAVCAGRDPSPEEWLDVRLAGTNAAHACKQAVGLLYESLGTTGVYRRSTLDRQLRDLTTLCQHVLVQSKTYTNVGRGLLGLPPGNIAF